MDYLVYIAMVLLLGTLVSTVAAYLKVSNVFFLVLIGMLLGSLNIVEFPPDAVITISLLTLIMIIFDSTIRFKIKEVIKYSSSALKLVFIFLVFNLIFLSLFTRLMFGIKSWLLVTLFAILMYGIDPGIALSVLKHSKNKVVEILEIEALANTPLTVVIALIILNLLRVNNESTMQVVSSEFIPFAQQIFVGVGFGLFVGYIITTIIKNFYLGDMTHLTVITAAIISYVFAEVIGGNGVLGVTTFGLFFGNFHMKHKIELEKFASIFTNTLKILVFILLGTMLSIEPFYLINGILLFIGFLAVRFVSVVIALGKEKLSFQEKLFMTLNMPKGIDVVVVLLIIVSSYSDIPGMGFVINLSMLFVLLSIVLSTVLTAFKPDFLE